MRDNEAETVRTLTTYREVIATLIQEHQGRVVDTLGGLHLVGKGHHS